MALLLLAAAARPGRVEAFSVDHGLRAEAAAEVAAVGALCSALEVPFHPLALDLEAGGNVQARARAARYAAMADAARDRGLVALATAHHADDQTETLLMRLARGAGLSGLAGIRPVQPIAGIRVVRPLLGWRKAELERICSAAGVGWADDPSNVDPRFDRARVRRQLAALDLDIDGVAQSASHLAQAEEALAWAVEQAADRLRIDGHEAMLDVDRLPDEIVRRLMLRAFALLGAEAPRGPDLQRAVNGLVEGKKCTLSGLLLTPLGATCWRLAPEPARRA